MNKEKKKNEAGARALNDDIQSPQRDCFIPDESISNLSNQLKKTLKVTDNVLLDISMDGVVEYMKNKTDLKIITMVGAGISTAAGIPDFRSPGSGIYHNLQRFNLSDPTDIFKLHYFISNPAPFYSLVRELFLAGKYKPTKSHWFIRLLQDKNMLLRHFTQNVDGLERFAGLLPEKLVEAHGSFYTSTCLNCKASYDFEWLETKIRRRSVPKCNECSGVVKPDIVFVNEQLPDRFYEHLSDFESCNLLIIMGSSLTVDPFASLIKKVDPKCPRLMINDEPSGENLGFMFGRMDNTRDVLFLGECDVGCQLLVDKLGWTEEFRALCERR